MDNISKLIVAAAWSWKTTYLVDAALSIESETVLITTYTEANEAEIRNKIIKKKWYMPKNIHLQWWFSFLLQHGVKPYQSILWDDLHEKDIGFYLSDKSTTHYKWRDEKFYSYSRDKNFYEYYFLWKKNLNICSDTIADFVYSCNNKSWWLVVKRIGRIYKHIFIDEVQDLAGWDLDIIGLLLKEGIKLTLLWDFRQITYLTNYPKKNFDKSNKRHLTLLDYLNKNKKLPCVVETETLKNSHRNAQLICDYSYRLFPDFEKSDHCDCEKCDYRGIEHQGVFIIRACDVEKYKEEYKPIILNWDSSISPDRNFWKSKGLTFERVLINPTSAFKNWMKDNRYILNYFARCKFYVALTRARYSVAITYDYKDDENIEWVEKFKFH